MRALRCLHSRRLLLAIGDLVVGWLLLRRAEVALRKLSGEPGSDEAFYTGVVATARFFSREVLPRLGSDRRIIELATLDTMDLDEAYLKLKALCEGATLLRDKHS